MRSALLAMILAIPSPARAGDMAIQPPKSFPTLATLVRNVDLVLRCRAETVRGKTRWRVIEAIKGEYRPKMFDQETAGFISWTGTSTLANASRREAPAKKHDEEIVFIRLQRLHSAEDNKWHDLYYPDESFPVVAGKINYPKTILWGHALDSVDREYTSAEFSAAIKAVQ